MPTKKTPEKKPPVKKAEPKEAPFVVCGDCDTKYPVGTTHCTRCGNPL